MSMKFKRPKRQDLWPFSLHETLALVALAAFAISLASTVRYVRADPDCHRFTINHCD